MLIVCICRNEDDELYEVRKYKKAKMLRKKLNILPTLKEPWSVLYFKDNDISARVNADIDHCSVTGNQNITQALEQWFNVEE